MERVKHLTQSRKVAKAPREEKDGLFAVSVLIASLRLCAFAFFLSVWQPHVVRGQERDVAAEFKAVKGPLTAQLRGKKANRLEAVKKLEAYPTPEAAKLLLHQGMGSNDEDVARASFDALVKFSGDKEVCALLKLTVGKSWKQGKPQAETYAAIAILLASELPEAHDEAMELVKEAADRPTSGQMILITLADELANCRGDNAARPLIELMDLPLFEHDFAFRRAVEQALVQVRSKPAVMALIQLLPKVRGEVRADIVRYLTEISGQQSGVDAAAWLSWWNEKEKTFEFPPEKKPLPVANLGLPAPKPQANGPSYYGLPLSGSKIIFIIDTSGSMIGPRIFAAKRELLRAIKDLPEGVEFNIIAFNSRTFVWQQRLVAASGENKQSAEYFVAALGLASQTASYDALDAALQFDGEAIYFLTDGAPVGGRVTSPPDIVRAITQQNRFRRMTINSLGIGAGPPGSAFDSFLSALAQNNFGVYERVDQ